MDLNQPLSWKKARAAKDPDSAAALAMLNDLQGNILKGHGREHTVHLFLAFDEHRADKARAFVRTVAGRVTTALDQLTGAALFKATGQDAGLFTAMLLTAGGYRALGLAAALPEGQAFRAGMRARTDKLKDPPASAWDKHLASGVHAMVLLADDDEHALAAMAADLEQRIAATGKAVRLVGQERGRAMRNDDEHAIEHFGYVDGRSQPLALVEDIEAEKQAAGAPLRWDPTIPLKQLLVRCPGGRLDASMGSFFVFRKLEQDVQGFKTREKVLAEAMRIKAGVNEIGQADDEERAGASVVGRFENGTPVVSSPIEQPVGAGALDVPNNFAYDPDPRFPGKGDPQGMKCPFGGHVRKTNPRRADAQEHLMARRGITYGKRADDPNDGRLDNKPTGGVGLLFMAYQSSIENQFEFTQEAWANNTGFDFKSARQPVGIDPVIGQPKGGGSQRYPKVWGADPSRLTEPFDFSGHVRMRGGEYFFAPCVSFLRTLA